MAQPDNPDQTNQPVPPVPPGPPDLSESSRNPARADGSLRPAQPAGPIPESPGPADPYPADSNQNILYSESPYPASLEPARPAGSPLSAEADNFSASAAAPFVPPVSADLSDPAAPADSAAPADPDRAARPPGDPEVPAPPSPPAGRRARKKLNRPLALILAAAAVIGLAVWWSWDQYQKKKTAEEFQDLLGKLEPFVRAEDNFPPLPQPLLTQKVRPENQPLLEGAAFYALKNYHQAAAAWEALSAAHPEPSLTAFQAAASFRDRNFSLAARKYQEVLQKPASGREEELQAARSQLGLSLALFQLSDFPGAQSWAEKALASRRRHLGPLSRETCSAANILASAFMAQKENRRATDLLEETSLKALKENELTRDPVLIDSMLLSLLAYSLDSRLPELNDLKELAARREAAREGEPDGRLTAEPPPADKPNQPNQPAGPAAGSAAAQPAQPVPEVSLTGPIAAPSAGRPPQAPAPPGPGPDEIPEPAGAAPEPAPPEDLRPAFDLAQGLALYRELKNLSPDSPALPDLLTALITRVNGHQPPGAEAVPGADSVILDPREHLALCLDLARLLTGRQEFYQSLDIYQRLLIWNPEAKARREILAQSAQVLALAERWPEAEDLTRKVLESLPPQPAPEEAAFYISQAVFLADLILKQGRLAEEAELELVALNTKLLKQPGRRALDANPALARLYLRLAQLLDRPGRTKDSHNYIRQAERILAASLKADPGRAPEIARLRDQLPKRGRRPAAPPAPPAAAPALPAPEVLRLELAAAKLIGRLDDFEPRIQQILAQTNSDSDLPLYRRYLSLKLKYLEEKEDTALLVRELDTLINNPIGTSDLDKNRFALAALNYKVRQLAKNNQAAEAAQACREMLEQPHLASLLSDSQKTGIQNQITALENQASGRP